ncbi:hypothetical protein G7Z17_g10717 [Cylindrodendrum hubeiense]|uniref:Uncharacterized protein n=1 Tax=Cylindrodendrum hubeiense TaxID=595255 RepID=A0A9P5GYZ6_9HYPO|nr:hypothetical protein G7Z17_g10717 [Cylindrodendrum hubeiense]
MVGFLLPIILVLEQGFDKDDDWIQQYLDADGRKLRRKQRVVNMLPGCKNTKGRVEYQVAYSRHLREVYSKLKAFDAAKLRAVLYGFGARFRLSRDTIDGLLADKIEECCDDEHPQAREGK